MQKKLRGRVRARRVSVRVRIRNMVRGTGKGRCVAAVYQPLVLRNV